MSGVFSVGKQVHSSHTPTVYYPCHQEDNDFTQTASYDFLDTEVNQLLEKDRLLGLLQFHRDVKTEMTATMMCYVKLSNFLISLCAMSLFSFNQHLPIYYSKKGKFEVNVQKKFYVMLFYVTDNTLLENHAGTNKHIVAIYTYPTFHHINVAQAST